jgi:DNA polymerase-3 subunit delta
MLYYGEAEYPLKKAVQRLRHRIVPDEAMKAFGYKLLERPSLSEVVETVGATTLAFASETLLEIQEFKPFTKSDFSKADEAQLDSLKALLLDLPENRTVLFVNTKIDRKVKFSKWFTTQASLQSQAFEELPFWKTEEATQQLLHACQQEGISLPYPVAEKLVGIFGVSLQPLMNEAHKLAVYAGNQPITLQAVDALSPHLQNSFGMLEQWVFRQQNTLFFETLHELLLHQHPVQLFALTQSFLDNVFKLRLLQQHGMTPQMIADQTKKHPFKVKKDLETFSAIPFQRLLMLKEKAVQLEFQAKTGKLNDRLALEMLLST